MSAPTWVQDSGVVTASGVTTIDLALTSPITGNLIVVLANDILGSRTLTFRDFVGNNYQVAVSKTAVSNSKTDYIADSHLTIAGWSGAHNVSVDGNIPGNCNISGIAIEVSGQATSPLDVTGSIEETVGVSSHASTDTPLNTAVNVFVVTGGQLNVDDRAYVAGSGYTALGDDGALSFFQYQSSDPALTSELGNWTSNTSNRKNTGVIASYKAPAAVSSYILVHN